MTPNYIEFKKKREIGDLLSVTFQFLRQHYKPLFMLIFKIAGPAFILLLGASAYYLYSFNGLLDPSVLQNGEVLSNIPGLFLALALIAIAIIAFYSLQLGIVLNYVKSYIKHQGEINEEEIKQGVQSKFGSLLGLGTLTLVFMGIGIFFCVLPGIYLYVPMSITFGILVFDDTNISDAIARSFKLVKNEWWLSFLTLMILGLIIGMASMVFHLPILLYSFTKEFTSVSESSKADPKVVFDGVYIALSILKSAVQYLSYTTTSIGMAFIYYNLNERKNATGTLEQIGSLGKNE